MSAIKKGQQLFKLMEKDEDLIITEICKLKRKLKIPDTEIEEYKKSKQEQRTNKTKHLFSMFKRNKAQEKIQDHVFLDNIWPIVGQNQTINVQQQPLIQLNSYPQQQICIELEPQMYTELQSQLNYHPLQQLNFDHQSQQYPQLEHQPKDPWNHQLEFQLEHQLEHQSEHQQEHQLEHLLEHQHKPQIQQEFESNLILENQQLLLNHELQVLTEQPHQELDVQLRSELKIMPHKKHELEQIPNLLQLQQTPAQFVKDGTRDLDVSLQNSLWDQYQVQPLPEHEMEQQPNLESQLQLQQTPYIDDSLLNNILEQCGIQQPNIECESQPVYQ